MSEERIQGQYSSRESLIDQLKAANSTIAAKDAELARLRGVVEVLEEARTLVAKLMQMHKLWKESDIPFEHRRWAVRAHEALAAIAAIPAPAEAGENPSLPPTPACGDKTWTHPSDCHVCRQLRAAPSDAKAGERP